MKRLITICLCVLFVAGTALADWDAGDPYKMHWPQLPDPYGWDVKATTILNPDYDPEDPESEPYLQHKVLADDWQCPESGPVKDIHFWGSWKEDEEVPIIDIHLSIHADVPAGSDPDPDIWWSHPGEELWSLDTTAFTVAGPFNGEQGWYNPNTEEWNYPDHYNYYQYNIVDIEDPFWQEEGKIYWLDIQVTVPYMADGGQAEWGWKTSLDHWGDDAVYSDSGEGPWYPLYDPTYEYPNTLDLAFVITPEPATIALLGLGSLALIHRKRKA